MSYLHLEDLSLFFTDDGEGEVPLLFVHGYSADSNDWSWQLPPFAADHRVIAADLRGHGASSTPANGYTTEQFAADLVALVDHLGVARVVAIGHSMGGTVVSRLAVEHPDRVAAIVAVDPAYLLPDEVAGAIGPVLDALPDDEVVPFVQAIVGDGMDTPDRDPALRSWQVRRIATVAPHVLRRSLLAQVTGLVLRSQSEPYLRRRRCPVLSFHADPARAELEAQTFADDRSRVVVWDGANHWLQQVRWTELNEITSEWLASLE